MSRPLVPGDLDHATPRLPRDAGVLILAVFGMAGSALVRRLQKRIVFWEGTPTDLPRGERP